jgi:hypothetical protein
MSRRVLKIMNGGRSSGGRFGARLTRAIAGVAVMSVVTLGLPVIAPPLAALLPPAAAETVPASGEFKPLPAARVLDTRNGTGGITGPLSGGQEVNLTVLGRGGVPSNGVLAVAVKFHSLGSTSGSGYVTVWPAGQPRP